MCPDCVAVLSACSCCIHTAAVCPPYSLVCEVICGVSALFPSGSELCCGVPTMFHALSRLLWCIRFASRCVQTVVRCVRLVSLGSHMLLLRDQRSYRVQMFQRRRDGSRSHPQVLRAITKDRAGPSVYSLQFFSAFVRFCLDFVLFFRCSTVFCFVFKMRLYKCFVVLGLFPFPYPYPTHQPLEIAALAGESYLLPVVPSGKAVSSWAGPHPGFLFLFSFFFTLPVLNQLV